MGLMMEGRGMNVETLRGLARLPVRFVAVDDKLGIGAAAQLMQVHADAFAVGIDPEGDEAVEQAKSR